VSRPEPQRARRRHTVVLSDVHLSQAHPEDPSDPLWMRYRIRAHHPDSDLATLVDHLLATRGDDSIELVWNGDVFDFDAPWVKDGQSSFDEFPFDETGCTEHFRRILADHPVWLAAAARLLSAGHRLLVVSGNHDVELYWPGVRRTLLDELGGLSGLDAARLSDRIRFRNWFHVTEDGIYLEHGSQYDLFSSVRYPMLPLTRDRASIHPQTGKLAFKRTGARMGYFNPYDEETFYLGLSGYLGHWLRFYARSDRHIFRTWLSGALRTVADIWRRRHREDWTIENRALARAESGASDEAIDRTMALAARPAEDTMLPILRELWLDRLAMLAGVIALGPFTLALGGQRSALVALAAAAAGIAVYEHATPKPDLRTYDSTPRAAEQLFAIHGVRAVCLGHTHRPSGVWEGGDEPRFSGNSGAWCPAFRDQLCQEPVFPRRPLLLLTSEDNLLSGGLFWWDGTALCPEPGATRG
jgi:UDP-2,3-diacylglucosamine pyrophosphatase LpxH